jgi:hypothetical protein
LSTASASKRPVEERKDERNTQHHRRFLNLKLPNLIVSNVVIIFFLLWAVDDSVAAVDAAL